MTCSGVKENKSLGRCVSPFSCTVYCMTNIWPTLCIQPGNVNNTHSRRHTKDCYGAPQHLFKKCYLLFCHWHCWYSLKCWYLLASKMLDNIVLSFRITNVFVHVMMSRSIQLCVELRLRHAGFEMMALLTRNLFSPYYLLYGKTM